MNTLATQMFSVRLIEEHAPASRFYPQPLQLRYSGKCCSFCLQPLLKPRRNYQAFCPECPPPEPQSVLLTMAYAYRGRWLSRIRHRDIDWSLTLDSADQLYYIIKWGRGLMGWTAHQTLYTGIGSGHGSANLILAPEEFRFLLSASEEKAFKRVAW